MFNISKSKIKIHISTNLPRQIDYGFVETQFGKALLGCHYLDNGTPSLCQLYFDAAEDNSGEDVLRQLQCRWPKARIQKNEHIAHRLAKDIFRVDDSNDDVNSPLSISLFGTEFQQRVWRFLLQDTITQWGNTCTYSEVANALGKPRAVRAVANAVARNELAVVVPCHRVVAKSPAIKALAKYRWGGDVKRRLLDYEANNK